MMSTQIPRGRVHVPLCIEILAVALIIPPRVSDLGINFGLLVLQNHRTSAALLSLPLWRQVKEPRKHRRRLHCRSYNSSPLSCPKNLSAATTIPSITSLCNVFATTPRKLWLECFVLSNNTAFCARRGLPLRLRI